MSLATVEGSKGYLYTTTTLQELWSPLCAGLQHIRDGTHHLRVSPYGRRWAGYGRGAHSRVAQAKACAADVLGQPKSSQLFETVCQQACNTALNTLRRRHIQWTKRHVLCAHCKKTLLLLYIGDSSFTALGSLPVRSQVEFEKWSICKSLAQCTSPAEHELVRQTLRISYATVRTHPAEIKGLCTAQGRTYTAQRADHAARSMLQRFNLGFAGKSSDACSQSHA